MSLDISCYTPASTIERFRHLMAGMALVCLSWSGIHAHEVKFVWNPNPEPDIAGYVIHYGTQSGNLTQKHETGNVTTSTVTGLESATTYYFALQAYNTSGLYSDLTDEISHTTAAPPPTGLVLRDESGRLPATDGKLLDLGLVKLGSIGGAHRLTLTNHGPDSASGLRWQLEGSAVENFVVEGMDFEEVASLAPDESITFTVRFKPTEAGVRSVQLRLVKDGDTENVFDFQLRGTASISYDTWLAAATAGELEGEAGGIAAGPLNPLQQFAFGTGPGIPPGKAVSFDKGQVTSRGTPTVLPPAGPEQRLQGVFARRKDREIVGLVYRPQFSADLIHWHDVTDEPLSVADDGEIEIISTTAPESIDGKPARFFRLGVEQVTPPAAHDFVQWLAHHQAGDILPGSEGRQQLTRMLMEYAFGQHPGNGPVVTVSEIDGLVATRGNPGVRPPAGQGETFNGIFARRKNHEDVGLTYHPQFSADLIHWHDAAGEIVVLADDGEIQVVAVSAPVEINGLPARFFRLGVQGPMPEPPAPLEFDEWLAAVAAGQTATAHHLMAYGFGLSMDPAAGAPLMAVYGNEISRGLPNVIPPTGPQQAFRGIFSRRISHADVGLTYHPQFSADLIHWHDATANPVVLARDGEIEAVSVGAPAQINGQPARFFRVGITIAPGF